MTSDFDIDSILKDSDEMMANMRGQNFKSSDKSAAPQQPHELDKYLVDADEMMGNLHGQKPKKESSPEHVESFRDTLFPEGGWGLKRGLESALGPEKRPDTVAAALHQIGFGNINEQQKAIADSVSDPTEIAEFPAWHEKTPEQKEIAYQHSKKEYTAGDVWDTAKGALASLGGLGESAVMGAGKAAYDLGPGVVEMNLRMAGAKSEEEKKRIENEYSQRFANVFRSVPEAFGQVGHEVGSIVEQGKAAGFPMVDRLASKFGMMSDDTRREHFMVRDALKTHDAQVSAQNPSMTGRMAKSAYRALIDWTGPSIEDILHMHPEFKGDREKAKAFKDKESKKKTDEALGQWINEMNTHPVDPDVMTLPTLIPLAEGLPAANMFALGERTLAGALDLSTAARRVASGMTRAEWGAAQLAKAEAKLADSAAKASELGRVGRAAGYLAGKGEQAIQAGEQALGKVEQAGEAAKAEYDRIFENAPEKMRGYLEKSMPVLGAAGVGGAIGALADPESELKGAAKGALFGAAALQVPRLAYDIARASAKNAGGTAGVFGTLAKDADSGWGARMLVGNGIPPQGGNWMQTMLARRPQVFDWMVNNTKDMANSAIHITPMAVTLGMLDSNDPKGFVDSMLQGWAWAVGPQLYHKALGKDPFQSARERKQYDHQVYKFKSTLSEETLKRMNHFADIGTEVQSAKDHLDLVTQDYQKATEGKEKGAEMTPEEQVHGILVAKARLRYEAALRNASTPEGKDEYAKQFWYRMADIDAHISGAIEPGKNVKVELMTTDDMLDKLGKSNMKGFEALGGPVPQKPLSQWGPEDLNTLSPEQQAYYTKLKFFSEAEGVNYLRSHTRVHNGERIDKQNGKHVIWEPEMEKGTVALNADVIFDNMINNGDAFLSVYSHEMGHALDGFDEHKKRSATLRKKLFGEEMKDASGNTIGQIPGLYDDKHLFDLFQTKYGKSNASLTPEQVAEKMGFFDPDTMTYDTKGIVDMMKDEVMADMNSTGFYRNYFFNRPKGAAALVDWMTVKDQNSKLSRLARRMAGLQPGMPVFGERSGAMFTPEVQRMADQHMREMRALHGDMMPHNPEETIVPPIDKKDIIANKELSDYYLTDTGRFKTEMAGIVYDAEGNKVAEIVLQDPEVSEGSWFHHTNEAGESSITQGHGDGEMPPELEKIPIPMGGHAMSTHRLMRDPSGKPIENDTKATRELINLRSQMVRDAIDNAGDVGAPGRLRPVSPGSNSYRGQLTDAQMEAIRRLPNRVVPYSIKQKLFDINKSLVKNDGTRLLLDYATRIDAKGNYVPFSPKIVDVVPIGMMFSTDGHFLMTGVSVSRMMSKLDRWEAFMPARLKPWNGSKNKFMEEIVGSYLENHSKGYPGSGYAEDGTPVEGAKQLAPTPKEAEAKRDVFNDFFNMYDSSTVDRNPDRTELPKLKLTREQRKEDNLVKLTKEAKKLERSSNQNTMVRSFRLDSIMDMAVSDLVKIPVDYYKVKMNASLEARAREQEQRPRLEAIPDVLSRMNMRYTPRAQEAGMPQFSVLSRERAEQEDPTKVAPGFYSKAGRVLLDKMPNRASADQIRGILDPQKGSGVKPDEMKWSGINQFIDATQAEKGFVTKDDIKQFLKDGYAAKFETQTMAISNKYVVSDSSGHTETYNTEKEAQEAKQDWIYYAVKNSLLEGNFYVDQNSEGEWVVFDKHKNESRLFDSYYEYEGDAEDAIRKYLKKEWESNVVINHEENDDTQYHESQYMRPGGTNYEEVVLRMPGVDYTSHHFNNVPNYVAHMRTQDFGNGRLIEELQSDLHQAGREKGYKNEQLRDYNRVREIEAKGQAATPEERKEWTALMNAGAMRQDGVADAPFRKDWHLQLFKHALQKAVADGKEWVGWTGGEAQADRYALSKQVDKVNYDPHNKILVAEKNRQFVFEQEVAQEKLADYIGKELASKLLQTETLDGSGNHVLSGLDLNVGGEGMKGFYDKILPNEISKYVKQWGATVEPSKIGNAGIWKIAITPEMSKSVAGGQARFSIGAALRREKLFETETGRPDPQGGYRWASSEIPADIRFMPSTTEGALEGMQPELKEDEASIEPPKSRAALNLAAAPEAQKGALSGVRFMTDREEETLKRMPMSAVEVLHSDSLILPKPEKKRTNADIAIQIADVAERYHGQKITSSNITPEIEKELVVNGADEAEAALKASGKNAANWYSTAIQAALGVAAVLHKVLTDTNSAKTNPFFAKEVDPLEAANFALRLPLAITSQNMTVPLNARFAEEQFNTFQQTGKFDPSKEYGSKAKSISANLNFANEMIERLGGILELQNFVKQEFTVRELETAISNVMGKKIGIAGRKDDIVNGAAIFGPKIGQGFLQNLMGKFDPVTIDLWMRRTWGRWTGDVVGDGVTGVRLGRMIQAFRDAGKQLPDSIKRLKTVTRSTGLTETGRPKKPELTVSENIEDRIESDLEFRKDLEQIAKETHSEFQKHYALMSSPMSVKLANEVRAGMPVNPASPTQAELESLDRAYRKVVKVQSEIDKLLDEQFSALTTEQKKALNPEDSKTAIKKDAWIAIQHAKEKRTEKLKNSEKNLLKPEWAKAAQVIVSELNQTDVPSDQDRMVISRVVNNIRQELESRGFTLTNADVQAILWYPEKDLWAKLAGKKESNLKQSYDDEFIKIAEQRGLGEQARAVAKQIRGY